MADPVIDERWLAAQFTVDVAQASSKAQALTMLQEAATLLILDAYDRKIPTEEFADILSPVLYLYSYCAKVFMLASISTQETAGTLDRDMLKRAGDGLLKLIDDNRRRCMRHAYALSQCPLSTDTVN